MNTTKGERRPRRWLAVCAGVGVLGAVQVLALAMGPPAGAPAAKPEYARVTAVPGLVSQQVIDGVTRSVFTSQDRRWTAVLLENQISAALEDKVQGAERPPVVTVTGVVSEYRGRNYLLLTAALVGLPAPEGT